MVKDLVDVKTETYESFLLYGSEIASRVRQHREANCGVWLVGKTSLYRQIGGAVINVWTD